MPSLDIVPWAKSGAVELFSLSSRQNRKDRKLEAYPVFERALGPGHTSIEEAFGRAFG